MAPIPARVILVPAGTAFPHPTTGHTLTTQADSLASPRGHGLAVYARGETGGTWVDVPDDGTFEQPVCILAFLSPGGPEGSATAVIAYPDGRLVEVDLSMVRALPA